MDKDEVREASFKMLTDTMTDRLKCRSTKRRCDVQLVANLNFKFPQVVWQHTFCVVLYITWFCLQFTFLSDSERIFKIC